MAFSRRLRSTLRKLARMIREGDGAGAQDLLMMTLTEALEEEAEEDEAVASELGFSTSAANSIDATSARDVAAELAFVLAMVAVDVSRIAEEVIASHLEEYGELEEGSFAVEACHIKIKDSDIAAHIWRFLFDTARQYRESFDVYGTKKSFEWTLIEGDEHDDRDHQEPGLLIGCLLAHQSTIQPSAYIPRLPKSS